MSIREETTRSGRIVRRDSRGKLAGSVSTAGLNAPAIPTPPPAPLPTDATPSGSGIVWLTNEEMDARQAQARQWATDPAAAAAPGQMVPVAMDLVRARALVDGVVLRDGIDAQRAYDDTYSTDFAPWEPKLERTRVEPVGFSGVLASGTWHLVTTTRADRPRSGRGPSTFSSTTYLVAPSGETYQSKTFAAATREDAAQAARARAEVLADRLETIAATSTEDLATLGALAPQLPYSVSVERKDPYQNYVERILLAP